MDDLISRSDAIRLAEQGQIQGFPWQFEQLVKLPSAQPEQPERKKGKWIDDGFQEEWWGEQFTCSICGGTMIGVSNYCSDCGADMRGDPE